MFYFFDIVVVSHEIVEKTEAVDHVDVIINMWSHDDLSYRVLCLDVSPGLVSSTLILATGTPGLYPFAGPNEVISLSANQNTGSQQVAASVDWRSSQMFQKIIQCYYKSFNTLIKQAGKLLLIFLSMQKNIKIPNITM